MVRPLPKESERPVWVRGDIFTTRCPRSLVSGESTGWLDLYAANQCAGVRLDPMGLDARAVEALLVIEAEHRKEMKRGGSDA